jgi:RNA polymerase sigma-70 factor (ECF subfamily)
VSGIERQASGPATETIPARPEDADLLRLLQEQPRAAAAALYDRYGRIVFSVALRIVGDRGVAEEITQDVFVASWRSAGRYRPEQGSLVTWLLAITHHRSIDELRSRRQKARARESTLEAETFMGAAGDSDLEVHLLQAAVRAAMADLPPAQRQVIELLYFGGLTRQEAANHLRTPLGTIHTRLRLGMARLRAALSSTLNEDETT